MNERNDVTDWGEESKETRGKEKHVIERRGRKKRRIKNEKVVQREKEKEENEMIKKKEDMIEN